VPTASAFKQQATLFEQAAVEVLLKLGNDEFRKSALVFHPLVKRGPVRRDGLVQDGVFRRSADVAVESSRGVLRRVMPGGGLGHAPGDASRMPSSNPSSLGSFVP
jgi:hypothetical protein